MIYYSFIMNELASKLNETLGAAAQFLSTAGRHMYFPYGGILGQGAEAEEAHRECHCCVFHINVHYLLLSRNAMVSIQRPSWPRSARANSAKERCSRWSTL